MARNDGIDRTVARNQDLETPADVAKVQEHNEREKDSYSNQDIVPERTSLNVHFKAPTDDYVKMFEQMEQDGVISTRGLKPDAVKYGELIFDVNSAYFCNHGGYEFAKEFYADAYKAAVEIVGGEQYILSAVMHADERNRAMSEALGEEVYHYHLHVVYIPVVEKQILWSKRCKDEALRGTVKETITQVSRSKKWDSKPVLDENGNPMLNAKGKKILKSSYSVLQDDFFHFMRVAGYTDLERGERGSTEEHLTVTQF
ncbi:plasmid recombination protein, partial [uncultured Ruminococcus sp.]|uniref:plasmid recombination protein n=1 Tax=uncultured Ruminococcus sp. TaxID=165186 RepID=UPI0026DC4FDF